jgi:hypothetical protein
MGLSILVLVFLGSMIKLKTCSAWLDAPHTHTPHRLVLPPESRDTTEKAHSRWLLFVACVDEVGTGLRTAASACCCCKTAHLR